jgi:hypothetical protein
MYAVLYAYTPEVFPTKDRGTGNALTATSNRIFGIMAPIIAMFASTYQLDIALFSLNQCWTGSLTACRSPNKRTCIHEWRLVHRRGTYLYYTAL